MAPEHKPEPSTDIDTGGGNYVGGDVHAGKDFVSRDKTEIGTQNNYYSTLPPTVESVDTSPAPGESPYQGMEYFDVGDADRFFGREQLTVELVEHLRHKSLLAIVGASGSGKSSLARAGLIPALNGTKPLFDQSQPPKGSSRWAYHIITPTSHPLESLAASLTHRSESVTATSTLIDDLRKDARSLHLAARRLVSGDRGGDQRLLLLVDQFEELFTLCKDETEQQAFVNNLLHAASEDGVVTLVLTLRADFYHPCAKFPELRNALETQQKYIGAMSSDELHRAIEEPAKAGKWEFQEGLVDQLLNDVGDEPGALPLLSHALLETWKRRSGRCMTLAGYVASGRVQGAIAKSADEIYNTFNETQQRIARTIFLRLTELGKGSQDTRRRMRADELNLTHASTDEVQSVLQALADARLVTTADNNVQVAHEALIRSWGELREWLDDDREGNRIQRRLTEAANDWATAGKEKERLYRGSLLQQAQEWLQSTNDPPNQLEMAFLQASQAEVKAEAAEREANRQRELENQRQLAAEQSRRALIFRNAVIVAGVLMLISLGLAEWGRRSSNRALNNAATATIALATSDASLMEAGKQRDRANQEAENAATRAAEARIAQATSERSKNFAQSQSLATISNSEQKNKPMRALLLAIEAGLRGDTVQAFTELNRQITDKALPIFTLFHSSDLAYVMWSEDGTKILTLSKDNTIHIWDGRDGHLLFKLQYSSTVMDVQWHGSYILTRSDNTVFIWDINNGHHLSAIKHVFPGDQGFWPDASFPLKGAQLRTDGDQVLTWGADLVCVWSSSSAKNLLLLKNTAEVAGAQWNINQDRILVWDKSNQMSIWDAANGQRLVSMSFEGYINGVRWSNDSQKLVTRNYDDQTRSDFADVWNIKDGKKLSTLKHTNDILGLEWSHDDTQIVTWGYEDNAVVWDSMTGQRLITLTHSNSNDILGARWSHDISRILTWENGNPVSVWDSRDGEELLSLRDGGLYAVWNSDESQIATWGFDDVARIWDANTGTQILALAHENLNAGPTYAKGYFTSDLWSNDAPPMSKIRQVQWNKDSNRILTWSGNNFVKVWDAKKNPELPILTHENALWAFWNEQENRIVTAGNDGTVRIWNESDGKLLLDLSFDLVKKKDDPMLEYYAEQVELSPDGLQLARWGTDNIVRVLNIMDGSYLFNLQHEGIVGGVRWSQDSHYLLSWGDENNARIWDAVTGQQLLELPHQNHILGATWNWQGTRILTRSSDQMVSVWDANNGKKLLSLPHEHNVNRAWWDESEQHIITLADSNNTVRIWNSQTGQLLDSPMALGILRDPVYWSIDNSRNRVLTWSHAGNYVKVSNLFDIRKSYTITDKPDNVIEALWSPNDKYILIYGGESARIWDSITGKILRTLRHNSSVTGAEWNSDATKVLTWEILGDNIGRVWDIKTGEVIMELNNGGNHFTRGNWNQDNSQIMYITSGTIVRSYTSISKIITSACKLVTRNLTWSEWQRYLPTEPYRRTCPNLPEGIGVSSDNSDTSNPSADFTQVVSVHDAATLITLPSQPDSPLTIYPNSPLLTPGE